MIDRRRDSFPWGGTWVEGALYRFRLCFQAVDEVVVSMGLVVLSGLLCLQQGSALSLALPPRGGNVCPAATFPSSVPPHPQTCSVLLISKEMR